MGLTLRLSSVIIVRQFFNKSDYFLDEWSMYHVFGLNFLQLKHV